MKSDSVTHSLLERGEVFTFGMGMTPPRRMESSYSAEALAGVPRLLMHHANIVQVGCSDTHLLALVGEIEGSSKDNAIVL